MDTRCGHAAANISGARQELDDARQHLADTVDKIRKGSTLEPTSAEAKGLSRAIKSVQVATGLEEGRAHGFSLRLTSLMPGIDVDEVSSARHLFSSYSRASTFSSVSNYGKTLLNAILRPIKGFVKRLPEDLTGDFLESRVNDTARMASAAFNSSIIRSTSDTPLGKLVAEGVDDIVSETEAAGYPGLKRVEGLFLSPETAPKLEKMGIKNVARSVSIQPASLDTLSENIKFADDVAPGVTASVSSSKAAFSRN